MKEALRTSAVMLGLMTILTGVIYPVVVTTIAQAVFPEQANGSLLRRDGKVVGSALIGQSFTKPGYFWGRLSATAPTPYNAAASGGSNLGPLNPTLRANAEARIVALKQAGGITGPVPIDLVTASGSGLDPHISPEAAELQVPRVARARGWSEDEVRRLVARQTEGRQFGVLGAPRVHVLRLNLALDASERTPTRIP